MSQKPNLTRNTIKLCIGIFCILPLLVSAANESKGTFSGAKPTQHPGWFKDSFLDFRNDIKTAARQGKRVLLYVYQDGCPYCNKFVDYNFAQKDILDKTRKHFDVVAVNLWGDLEVIDTQGTVTTEKEFTKSIGVKYTPTLVFFDEQGGVALRINGYYPPYNFRIALDYVAAKKEKTQSFRDYYTARTPTPSKGKLNKEDFFLPPPYNLADTAKRPLAVFFEQRQCDNCDLLHKETLNYPGTRDLIAKVDNIQLDMWDDKTEIITPDNKKTTPRKWAKMLNIAFAPSIVFFDMNGKEVARTDAFLKGFHTQTLYDYVINRGYESQPEFQRYLQRRSEALQAKGINVDIWD
ncbi:MAG: thioredoxin fold domain-containing protein [Gammaproteobacteria bacterium]|nr:thioredoxin fold domain-containing protein [Gammaproteobacteria bacterium]